MTNEEGPDFRALRSAAARRKENDVDPRWRALAEGRLSKDEVAALHDEAAQTPEGRELWELYRPFDPAEARRVKEGVKGRLRLRRLRRQVFIGLLPVAAAFGALFVHGHGVEAHWSNARAGEVPAPSVLSTPDTDFSEAILYDPGDPLVVRGALLVRDDDGRRLAWSPHLNPQGPEPVIRIVGTKKSVFPCVPAGVWDMRIAVGRKGPPVGEAEILAGDRRGFVVLHRRVVLEGAAVDERGERCAEHTP